MNDSVVTTGLQVDKAALAKAELEFSGTPPSCSPRWA